MNAVQCQINGKISHFQAKDLLKLVADSQVYESAYLRLKYKKEYLFLHILISGKLNVYEIGLNKRSILWNNLAEDFIHLHWVYRAQDWVKKYRVTLYFYKKEKESREKFSRSWKEKTKDCKLFQEKLQSKNGLFSERTLTELYNLMCQ